MASSLSSLSLFHVVSYTLTLLTRSGCRPVNHRRALTEGVLGSWRSRTRVVVPGPRSGPSDQLQALEVVEERREVVERVDILG